MTVQRKASSYKQRPQGQDWGARGGGGEGDRDHSNTEPYTGCQGQMKQVPATLVCGSMYACMPHSEAVRTLWGTGLPNLPHKVKGTKPSTFLTKSSTLTGTKGGPGRYHLHQSSQSCNDGVPAPAAIYCSQWPFMHTQLHIQLAYTVGMLWAIGQMAHTIGIHNWHT